MADEIKKEELNDDEMNKAAGGWIERPQVTVPGQSGSIVANKCRTPSCMKTLEPGNTSGYCSDCERLLAETGERG